MAVVNTTEEFLQELREKNWLLLDVRSQKEFAQGHIPGAHNLPLLNDEHRRIVGTTYKQQGRDAAVQAGFDLVGPYFGDFVRQTKALSSHKTIYLYCWRGGMRSGIMDWVLGMAGFQVHVLKGGYKSFRNWAMQQFEIPRKAVILGGATGSGKTELLQNFRQQGQQVIDLEGLANHKGSSFGALGQKPQPTYEQFENELAVQWSSFDSEKIVWLENESRAIGQVKIPDSLFKVIQEAPLIDVEVPKAIRAQRILNEYGHFSSVELAECTARLKKRLGGLRTQQALTALEEKNYDEWVEILLEYYDNTYSFGNAERKNSKIVILEMTPGETHFDFSKRILILTNEMLSSK